MSSSSNGAAAGGSGSFYQRLQETIKRKREATSGEADKRLRTESAAASAVAAAAAAGAPLTSPPPLVARTSSVMASSTTIRSGLANRRAQSTFEVLSSVPELSSLPYEVLTTVIAYIPVWSLVVSDRRGTLRFYHLYGTRNEHAELVLETNPTEYIHRTGPGSGSRAAASAGTANSSVLQLSFWNPDWVILSRGQSNDMRSVATISDVCAYHIHHPLTLAPPSPPPLPPPPGGAAGSDAGVVPAVTVARAAGPADIARPSRSQFPGSRMDRLNAWFRRMLTPTRLDFRLPHQLIAIGAGITLAVTRGFTPTPIPTFQLLHYSSYQLYVGASEKSPAVPLYVTGVPPRTTVRAAATAAAAALDPYELLDESKQNEAYERVCANRGIDPAARISAFRINLTQQTEAEARTEAAGAVFQSNGPRPIHMYVVTCVVDGNTELLFHPLQSSWGRRSSHHPHADMWHFPELNPIAARSSGNGPVALEASYGNSESSPKAHHPVFVVPIPPLSQTAVVPTTAAAAHAVPSSSSASAVAATAAAALTDGGVRACTLLSARDRVLMLVRGRTIRVFRINEHITATASASPPPPSTSWFDGVDSLSLTELPARWDRFSEAETSWGLAHQFGVSIDEAGLPAVGSFSTVHVVSNGESADEMEADPASTWTRNRPLRWFPASLCAAVSCARVRFVILTDDGFVLSFSVDRPKYERIRFDGVLNRSSRVHSKVYHGHTSAVSQLVDAIVPLPDAGYVATVNRHTGQVLTWNVETNTHSVVLTVEPAATPGFGFASADVYPYPISGLHAG